MSADLATIVFTGAFGTPGVATIEDLFAGGVAPSRIVAVVPEQVKASVVVTRGILEPGEWKVP